MLAGREDVALVAVETVSDRTTANAASPKNVAIIKSTKFNNRRLTRKNRVRETDAVPSVGASGRAEIVHVGPEHTEAQRLLRQRYVQMKTMALEVHPVIAIRIERIASWGALESI